ncbi:pseudouridylate synthase [Bacteriovorax sp. Seq25_V]|nr:pseudouridylate synthase [Bacteriovorax sp. Seq25_V]
MKVKTKFMKRKNLQIRLDINDILFESEDYIAVNKKAGWPVHSTVDKSRSNLFDALKSFIKQRDKINEDPYLALHHRLDVDTSGIVIFAKSKRANPILSDIFSKHLGTKKYQAICLGKPKHSVGELHHFLKKEKVGRIEKMVVVRSGGQKAILEYKLIQSKQSLSIVEFNLITGRMHQIRIQSATEGFPILGDTLYGDDIKNTNYATNGQLLHCKELSFFDKISNQEISIKCDAPFSLDSLGQKANDNNLQYILFNKPFNVLCQFTKQNENELCLGDYNLPAGVYAAGRLDKDSEGLLLLTNDGKLIDEMASPNYNKEKTYHVQVENIPSESSLEKLRKGVLIQGKKTRPCKVRILKELNVEPRDPPIRERANIPTCWLEIKITEGRNRQVRRMTAAINHPTLRLIRAAIDHLKIGNLKPGEYKKIDLKK